MSLNFPKTLMVLLFCVTFIGQTMASTVMSYHMMGMQGMSMAQMDHANHSMMIDDTLANSDKKLSEECCDHPCDCYTGSCSTSAIALIKDINNSVISNDSSKIQSHLNSLLRQRLASLYRPPIFS